MPELSAASLAAFATTTLVMNVTPGGPRARRWFAGAGARRALDAPAGSALLGAAGSVARATLHQR